MPKQGRTKICELKDCGKKFIAARKERRFCSRRCANIYKGRLLKEKPKPPKQIYTKICELESCGKEYTTTKKGQRFCSRRCVGIWSPKPPKRTFTKVCKLKDCGKKFIATREAQQFCCQRCANTFNSKLPRKNTEGYRRHALERWNNPEKRAAWLAASVSDEANQKRHDTQVGKIPNWSEEGKAKLLKVYKSKRGKPLTESTKQRIREAQLRTWSDPEYKEMMSEKRKKWCNAHPDEMRKLAVQGCLSQAESDGPNSLERVLYAALDALDIEYTPQHPMFDKFVVDAYLPQSNTVIEANGTYWHADPTIYGPSKKKMNKTQQLRLAQDASKAKYLEKKGYNLIVLWERDKENFVQMLKCKLNID